MPAIPHQAVPFPILSVLLLLIACCPSGCIADADAAPQPWCMVDKVIKESESRPIAVVRELPRKGQGAVQAYTASAGDGGDDSSEWAPIRILVSAKDVLDDVASGLLSEKDKNVLLNQALPAAIKLHAERLSVKPVTGVIIVPTWACPGHKIPSWHSTVGVRDADMILYVKAAALYGAIAWAGPCTSLADGRPVTGGMAFDPRYIRATTSFVRSVAHEIGHALGFVPRELMHFGLTKTVYNVRGKKSVTVVSSPTVKEMAQKYYNCSSLEGVELETDFFVSSMAHWERRNMKEDLMTSTGEVCFYSTMTLAIFHDMKVYRANFSMAEPMRWGNNSGCDFLENRCMINGTTNYTDMFCKQLSNDPKLLCTHDRLSLGRCSLGVSKAPVPPEYQCFPHAKLGSGMSYMDNCPFVEPSKFRGCTNGAAMESLGSFVGPNSRCVKGNELRMGRKELGDVCVNTKCEAGKLSVQFVGDSAWHECAEGTSVDAPKDKDWRGRILCPKYDDVCTVFPNISSYPIPVVEPPLVKEPEGTQSPDTGGNVVENGAQFDADLPPATGDSQFATDAPAEGSAGDVNKENSLASVGAKDEVGGGEGNTTESAFKGTMSVGGMGVSRGSHDGCACVVLYSHLLLLLVVAIAAATGASF